MRKIILSLFVFHFSLIMAQPAGVVLDTLHIKHIDGEGKTQAGVLVCNKKISKDLQEILWQR